MGPGKVINAIKQNIQNLLNINALQSLRTVLTRRRRLLGVGIGLLLLFLLFNLLYHSGTETDVVNVVLKKDAQSPKSEVVTIADPPQRGKGSQDSSDVTVAGYRKSSDFFNSIVQGNARAVCVGSDESRGEVEDLLCMVSSLLCLLG
ncbi:hypothetical protein ACOMHN_064803 [Nucella lapillus]